MRDPRPVARVIAEEGVAAAIGKKHVASLLFTYRCTLACRHCLFNCSPRKPAVCTSKKDAVTFLRQLHATDRVVHIAGGEAMMFYPELLEICRRAQRAGVAPHFIQTNASFAVRDEVTRTRLLELRDTGVQGLLISADPYHQEFCPPERYARCFRIAIEVFGRRNVAARDATEQELEECRAVGRDPERRRDYARAHPPLLVGRGGDELYPFFPERPVEQLTDAMWHGGEGRKDCRQEFDPETMWEIHIDPYGSIQTCCGIVLGDAKTTPLPKLMASGFLGRSQVVDAVYQEGPSGLLAMARPLGYQSRPGYPQKCGMCWDVRKFLRPYFPETLGPAEIYEADPVR
jgi:hypothetical protein